MMAEEWPLAAASAGAADAPVRGAGGDRLPTVRVDFFLDPKQRLTEQERALMTAMLHCLISDIADEIRAAIPTASAAANDGANLDLIESLSSARLLDRAALVRLLLRRADEERISTAARARSGRREARVLQGLVSHTDGAVSAAAMALILGRGKRRDRFGQCLIHFDDLPPVEAVALVHAVSAAMRGGLAAAVGSAQADRQLAAAGADVLSCHDPASSIEALTANLVAFLSQEGELHDELIVAAAVEGEMTFVAQALSRRSGLAGEVAMDEFLSGDARRLMALFRIGGVGRQAAASLLAAIGDLLGINDPGRAIDAYNRLSEAEVEDARNWLATDAAYRSAAASLGKADG
jgi:hypothetical protein